MKEWGKFMKTKRLLSAVLCISMMANAVPVFADTSSAAKAELTTAAMNFDITVPTSLPIVVDNVGNVSTASEFVITNNSKGSVRVSEVVVTTENNWEIVSYNKDFAGVRVDAKEFGMKLNGDEVATNGTVPLGFSWNFIKGDGGTLKVDYACNVAPQSIVQSVEIATVTFTLDWFSDLVGTNESHFGVEAVGEGACSITSFNTDYFGTVTIPETIGGLTVTSIAANAFEKCDMIVSVSIPSTVTSVGANAFNSCEWLTTVYVDQAQDALNTANWSEIGYFTVEWNDGTTTDVNVK